MPIGGFFLFDAAEDAVNAAGKFVSNAWGVIDDIPGFKELGDGTKDLFKGPLRDFANTAVGQTVIRALSGSLMIASYGLSSFPFLGPQLALTGHALAMAMPGMVKGEDFWSAYFSEGLWRVEQTAKILGADAANGLIDQAKNELGGALKTVQGFLQKSFPNALDFMTANAALSSGTSLSKFISPEALASRLGLPSLTVDGLAQRLGIQDINAAILQHYLYPERWPEFPNASSFDPVTGRLKGRTLSKVRVGPPPVGQQTMSTGVASALDKLFAQVAAREQAEAAVALAVADDAAAARAETAGNVALVGVVTAGALAGAWWYFRKR
jgi:hypothetical protein